MGRHSKGPEKTERPTRKRPLVMISGDSYSVPDQSHYKVILRSLRDDWEDGPIVCVDTDNTLHAISRAEMAIKEKYKDRRWDQFTLVAILAVPPPPDPDFLVRREAERRQ